MRTVYAWAIYLSGGETIAQGNTHLCSNMHAQTEFYHKKIFTFSRMARFK